MRAIMLMFDSLNKNMLSAYGNNDVITPNFKRLEKKTLTFDNFYVGSLPCMPARRELHTGRYNFFHRGWTPLEPFDDSMPELLKSSGIHSHLVTDHKHYWRDGGATYHSRYNTYEFVRGQEGDAWIGQVDKPEVNYQSGESEERKARRIVSRTQDIINRNHMKTEEDHHLTRTVSKGIEFIDRNKDQDNWFLQIECFDPHEPFFVPKKYLDMYGVGDIDFDGWPSYYFLTEDAEKVEIIQKYYKALLTMCDDYLGKVIDKMDEENLWEDTMFIVNTDHGFLLGEHDWWGKNIMPVYNEIANTPFFIWDPRHKKSGERRSSLGQTIDIPATILEYFHVERPKDMLGKSLTPVIVDDTKVRDYAAFGYLGCHANITDGNYVYMRSPKEKELNNLYEYTLMPTRINRRFNVRELEGIELVDGFDFTKGAKVLKVPLTSVMTDNAKRFGSKLYSLKDDPNQREVVEDYTVEKRLADALVNVMEENDTPSEIFERLGFKDREKLTIKDLEKEHENALGEDIVQLEGVSWKNKAIQEGFLSMMSFFERDEQKLKKERFKVKVKNVAIKKDIVDFILSNFPEERHQEILYRVELDMRIA